MEQLSRDAPRLGLTAGELRGLARGAAGREQIEKLRDVQLTRTLLLIRHLVAIDADLVPAATMIGRAYEVDPGAVREVLRLPWLGVWATQRTRGVASASVGYLDAIARRAANRAGMDSGAVDDWPTLTRYSLRRTGRSLHLTVDDVDPMRDCYGLQLAGRLTDAGHAATKSIFDSAWRLLADHVPAYADELAFGLTTFVPLGDAGAGNHSVTHSDAFGAFASEPALGAVELAVAMVHEFQHSKLSVVMHLADLFDPADRAWYQSPWRADPRPITGLLHGAYAFTAVADLWAALRVQDELAERAEARLAEVRGQLDRAFEELDRAASLTDAGRLLCETLAARDFA
ncbi:HEXXH motif-containing putative peptide modification protein [Hamadaea sp. NPDC051192]|uniref:aKG-HExxH-type peptide beta-hydroxylase n=1 Tax=Hamadaea sp. NPDC051192 TaxID=3154940 RepID=UPI003430427D